MSESPTNTYPTMIPQTPHRRRRTWPWLVLVAVLALGFVSVTQAVAQHRGFGGHHGRGDGPMTEVDLQEGLDHVLGFMLFELDATEAQEAEIQAIVAGVVPSLMAFHAEGDALKTDIHAALGADPIDAQAVEALRAQLVDLVDRASRSGVDALLDVSDVLTPEQRTELRERIHRFHR